VCSVLEHRKQCLATLDFSLIITQLMTRTLTFRFIVESWCNHSRIEKGIDENTPTFVRNAVCSSVTTNYDACLFRQKSIAQPSPS
jgi:hypothetical protein